MKNITNTTVNCVVYIENGTYGYTMNGNDDNGNGGYSNRTFSVIGYVSGDLVDVDNISTYPVILFDANSENCAFLFYMNISASFNYLKFYLGSNSHTNRRIFRSLFIYLLLLIIFFVGLLID
jgi:hypothetical protein